MTVMRFEGLETILRRLETVRIRRWSVQLASAVAAVATITMGVVVVVAAAGGYWPNQPPALLRWSLLYGSATVVAGAIFWYIVRAIIWRQNLAQTARFIEQAMPQVRNDLINSILLADDKDQVSPDLVQQAIAEAAGRARRFDMRNSVSNRRLKRWAIAGLAAAAVLAAFAAFQPQQFRRGLYGAVSPRAWVPPANRIKFIRVEPEDGETRFAGEPIAFRVLIDNPDGRLLKGHVIIEGVSSPRPLVAGTSNNLYTCLLTSMDQTFRYAVDIDGSRWPLDKPYNTVNVLHKAKVEGMDIEYRYPRYTQMKPKVVRNAATGDITAPMGSRCQVVVRLSRPVARVDLDLAGQALRKAHEAIEGRTASYRAEVPVDADGKYRLLIRNATGTVIQQLPALETDEAANALSLTGTTLAKDTYHIKALPDAPPRIEFLAPSRNLTLPPDSKVKTRIKVYDKYGLTGAQLFGARQGEPFRSLHHYGVVGKTEGQFNYTVDLAGSPAGSVFIIYATAADNRDLPHLGGPQTSTTGQVKFTIQDAAELQQKQALRYEELRKRLLALLRLQESLRVQTGVCQTRLTGLDEVRDAGQALHRGQRALHDDMVDLVEKFPFDNEMESVKKALRELSANEAQIAIDQAAALVRLDALGDRLPACTQLAATQVKIIDRLQMLLALMPSLGKKAEAKKPGAEGNDLPPAAEEKIRQLSEDLQKFLEAQRKVIEASERLAKKPVDNFTPEDEELLKELAAVEDKWEKFMKEAFADFSKLAQQDFSNPALLKELLSVKSDITMAKDALQQKAVDMAVAAEEGGAENAKSLTANLEKWLPDKPDREKWSMEDPMGGDQQNLEMPELPTELEDLVGDLLEQEEDLFEEMQDLTSKAAGSGDKGIGWDALDGPISNMNAQGVTGNQLPNPIELSGRSGEGRQGKSSGEFVEDKAVGKGGRRTPTRLTPEPFQKGEVNDTSKEPPGGASGGGKVSGAGGEGLEGPVPPELKKEMPRMAGKQAALVNKAERIRAQFAAGDYTNFKLLEAITLMNRLRDELDNYRYRNVLRQKKEVLGALGSAKDLVGGKIDVEADTSATLPKYIRDDINDAMNGTMPPEYREVLEQYYRRLSEQASR